MSTTRRGFLGSLLAALSLRFLAVEPSLPSVTPVQDGNESFDAYMSRRMAHYTGAIVPTKHMPHDVDGEVWIAGGREYILRSDPRHVGFLAGPEAEFS